MKDELGFKPANRYLTVTPKSIKLKIRCIQCGSLQKYNVNEENVIETTPCLCEGKRFEETLSGSLSKILDREGFELKETKL